MTTLKTECIVWTGAKQSRGYGYRTIKGKNVLAHRQAYEDAYGPIPPGLVIMHMCDNRPCVNPEHLKAGTQAENLQDMRDKGRARSRPKTYEVPS